MNSISTEFQQYDYSFNRSLSSNIELPFKQKDIEIGVNELANSYNFNTSVDMVHSNLMYLYSISKIANPDLPENYNGWIGTNTDDVNTLSLEIYNIQLFSAVKFNSGIPITSTIPYMFIQTPTGNYNIICSYDEYTNPAVDSLPNGINYTIDLSSDTITTNLLAATEVVTILTEIGLTASVTETLDNLLTLFASNTVTGDIFFGNKNPNTYQYLFGDNCKVTVVQGINTSQFSIYDSNITVLPNPSNYDLLVSAPIGSASLPGFKTMFLCSDTRIQTLSANVDNSDFKFVSYTDHYGLNNTLNFLNINSATINGNSLYIADESRNNVIQINVNGFTNSDIDTHRYNEFFETKIIGGLGGVRANYSFNKPKIIQMYGGYLYVFDQLNYTIKVYDGNLNFIRSIRKASFTQDNLPVKIKIFNDKFYWLTSSGMLFILDLNLNILSSQLLVNENNSESFLDILISSNNNNLYILTKANVYKYYLDSIVIISKFNFTPIYVTSVELKFFTSIDSTDNVDSIFVYAQKNGRGILLSFDESSNFFNLLSDYDFDIYSKDDIHLYQNEFASSFSYNKSIYKIINNILQFRNFVYRKINASKNTDNSFNFLGVGYFNAEDLEIVNFKPTMDNYIGVNEIFSRAVVNRVLVKLYNLQLSLLDLMKSNVTLPGKTTNYLTKSLQGLMMETYPSNPSDYILMENSDEDANIFNVIVQEYAILPETTN